MTPPADKGLIDLHCHILPGLDDGPSIVDDSLRMAEIALKEGINRVVATPHIREKILSRNEIISTIQTLQEELAKRDLPLNLLYGADVSAQLSPSLMRDYTINETDYILVEFPYTHLSTLVFDRLFELYTQGLRPVITHPERNPSVIRSPENIIDLANRGVIVQITTSSLTGGFGEDVRACAIYLLKKKAVHVLATDAHSPSHRPPRFQDAIRVVERVVGDVTAEKLLFQNPLRIITGQTID